jgi:hypothetical protein
MKAESPKSKEVKQLTIHQKLIQIQRDLKAPKNQWNSFGKYKYRSCEDILEGLKPILHELGLTISLEDEIKNIGDRYYVCSTAIITDGEHQVSTMAYAREEESKKGMDSSQVTGAASSYARKYSLNGLLAIDDTKDSDKTSDAKQMVEVDQLLINRIEETKSLADLTALCKEATTGKPQEYKKAVLVYYNAKKEKLGGNI